MKKTKEYKISVVMSIIALVLDGVAIVTGLIPNLDSNIDRICMYLGFAFLGFGLVFLQKAKDKSGDGDQ